MQEAMTHSNPAVFAVLASDDEALRDKCIGAMKRLKKLCKAEAETSFHLVPLLVPITHTRTPVAEQEQR